MASMFKRMRESVMPTLKETRFQEKGVLTPEEFVAAGDMLVYKCPTWSWESGSTVRAFLPEDKQFLITRNVPCRERVAAIEYFDDNDELVAMDDGDDEGDGWVATHMDMGAGGEQLAAIADAMQPVSVPAVASMECSGSDSDSDIPDMDDFDDDDNVLEDDDDATAVFGGAGPSSGMEEANILMTRTYDVSITYDKYYQTPRVWLFGYDETGQPLSQEQIFEDISQDHAKKTVTFEPHPHSGIPHASIHPCKHSNVMKKIIDNLGLSGQTLRADQYMFLFVKFISTIIPTIDYDHTFDMEG
ncbi:uncharacterized protein AMSG_05805 [Thecamonas trahens ATCC 50062]|uniref:Autophagy-related protein 3 n=1 Tax=Thecamonas trahens ATCC 50062 TaxID=461836 RepID=A0A0L0DCI1_THETB|nr:hypothetical protein AMSG_05805 [Thecamonas trahens ATCC 50062]KNC50044.1 hypothetical protein AMSG_05805 [Thecamonas trahens ATCC 50062]|eukprot:XP_013757210.1 hypothetical protein AMSG_05805 [Thecamonas trahens ATCC 50062]